MKNMLGVMLDCSRNGVMRPEKVKEFSTYIAKMGYNTLMLYTEDTYEVNNQPYFGYHRGRYTKAELKELDAYCAGIGISLVPCIQTLAHLNCIFKWQGVYTDINDVGDILLAGAEETYQLIDDMFATISECFSTKDIHIGMDEAHLVGLGMYLHQNGYRKRFDVINEHLHRVCEIAKKYGLNPMIWSDMFCKLALNIENYYTEADLSGMKELAAVPENLSLVYWDYYSKDYDKYVRMIKTNQMFNRPVIFAGGAWTWHGLTPDNRLSMETTEAALRACKDCGVSDVFITVWGDDGAECNMFSVLPSLLYAARLWKGQKDGLAEEFQRIVGVPMDAFMVLDRVNRLQGTTSNQDSAKFLLYSDPFAGLADSRCDGSENAYYAALAEEIAALADMGDFQILFDKYQTLCQALAVKANLSLHTRKAYTSGDREALAVLAQETYPEALARIKAFHAAHRADWMWEKRPQGFEIQDIRLGGLMQRLETCRKVLEQYLNGEISLIEELEEPMLPKTTGCGRWESIVTSGVISHGL